MERIKCAQQQVGSGGNEEAFNPQAQRAMTEYCEAIITIIWVDYTTNCG